MYQLDHLAGCDRTLEPKRNQYVVSNTTFVSGGKRRPLALILLLDLLVFIGSAHLNSLDANIVSHFPYF